ncbi:MAG: DUF4157 domain-containing protein [Dyadobacter fermentans]
MKTAEKSSAHSLVQRSQHPFFSKRGEDSFFAPSGTPLQPKVEIGQPDDPYEREADAMAEQIVQKKEAEPSQKDKQKLQAKPVAESITPIVRRKRTEEEEHTAPQGFENQLNNSKGGGSPMPESVKSEMESGFGHDFSDVRLHTGSNAVQMSRDMQAQAFTHGNDIYFNENKYNPGSRDGKRLLAHELTHTVQQGGGVQKKLVQKAGNQPGGSDKSSDPDIYDGNEGLINARDFKVKIPQLQIPRFKSRYTPAPLIIPKTLTARVNQRDIWIKAVDKSNFATKVNEKLQAEQAPNDIVKNGANIYYLKATRTKSFVAGTKEQIADQLTIPAWTQSGEGAQFDVDHRLELQLGGDNSIDNLWLMDASANRSSGAKINNELNAKIGSILTAAKTKLGAKAPDGAESVRKEGKYEIEASTLSPNLPTVGDSSKNYELDQIQNKVSQLQGLKVLNKNQITAEGFIQAGDIKHILLLSKPSGGTSKKIPWASSDTTKTVNLPLGRGKQFEITSITYTPGAGGSMLITAFKNNDEKNLIQPVTFPNIPITESPLVSYGGVINSGSVIRSMRMELKGMSPITLNEGEFDLEQGFMARGQVNPTLPFLKPGSGIDIVFDGRGVSLEKTFNSGEISLPSPFKVSNCSLTVSVGTGGYSFEGGVDFGIDKVGKGSVRGGLYNNKVAIDGHFEFDPKLFNNARVDVRYRDEKLEVTGTIEIPKNKVTGIKKATATVNYAEGVLTANGNAELDIKSLDKGSMNLRYDGKELTIGGSFELSKDIPRIKSGSVSASVTAKEGAYAISASGTAVPDIPGIDSTISINYADGALTVEGSVTYEKGIAKGNIRMGATNRAVGPDGVPSGKPGDKWTIYGEGSLTLRLTPWLQATAGVKFSPTGELSVSGKIGLPGAVNVFDRKDFNKNLFHFPTLEIPLLAIPVGPRSIGLVATIGGGVDFNAGFGPGKLEELFAEVNYTVGQEDSLSLHARGKFFVPADATIRIFGRAGIGVSIGIARVTGNIELGAAVGIKGAAEAEVDVNWDPVNGISLQAVGRVYVEPVLKFDVNLVLEAVLDLYFYELRKEWKKNLAQKEFGSGMRFGLEFPVKYKEGEPFNISADDIRVIQPDLDISTIVGRFKDELF